MIGIREIGRRKGASELRERSNHCSGKGGVKFGKFWVFNNEISSKGDGLSKTVG